MSKTTTILLLIFLGCVALIVVVVLQIPTPITKPVTNTIQSITSLDLTTAKDKIIAALTGTTALLTGGVTALIYGFWNRGKQLISEVQSKLSWQKSADTHISQLEQDREKLGKEAQAALSKAKTENETLTNQLNTHKNTIEQQADALKKAAIEQETLATQRVADFTKNLPGDVTVWDPKLNAFVKTVTKTVVK